MTKKHEQSLTSLALGDIEVDNTGLADGEGRIELA